MKRKFLEELGLEKETIDKILDENSKSIGNHKLETETKDKEIARLTKEVAERDTQLETLKKSTGDVEELKKQIKALQEDNKAKDIAHQKELEKEKINNAIKSAIGDQVHDIDLVINQFDMEAIKVADGNVLGIEEQLTALKDSKGFLFKEVATTVDAQPSVNVSGLVPANAIVENGGSISYEQRLKTARETGDSAGAIRIIDEAAQEGVVLI